MFVGFSESDFDAYAPDKWRSNVFNRVRLDVKQKLIALGRDVSGQLFARDGSPLLCEASVEHPALWNHKQVEAQHLFFSRNEDARRELDPLIDKARSLKSLLSDPTPQHNHVFLGVTLDRHRVEIALRLHPDASVDRRNLERRLEDPWQRDKLVDLVRALGSDFSLGVTEDASRPGQAGSRAGAPPARSMTGVSFAAHTLTAPELDTAWAQFVKPERPSHWLAITRTIGKDAATLAGPTLCEPVRAALSSLLPVYHFVAWSRDNDYVAMKKVLSDEQRARRQKHLAKNDTVRVVRGMFAGRRGTVQQLDAKGGLKVQLGTLIVHVAAADVEKT